MTMEAITLSAIFDGERIRLEEDFPLQRNARLLVTILPEFGDNEEALRDLWRESSNQTLSRAYGPEKPEYTMDMVREPNADYEGR